MTAELFVKQVEAYYGKYRPFQRKVVMRYLEKERFTASFLDRLFQQLIYTVSSQYQNVPDVAVIQQQRHEIAKQPPDWKPPVALLPDEGAEDRSREVLAIFEGFKARIKKQKEARAK